MLQCLKHYKTLSFKFENKQCMIDGHFPSFDSHVIIESSSSEDDEPMPSTSKFGLPPDKELTDLVRNSIDDYLKANNDLIESQSKICDDYLEKNFKESMHDADLIDDMTVKVEEEIKLMRSILYGPFKPFLSSLSSDSESESDIVDVEVDKDKGIKSDKIKDYKTDKNKEEESITNKLHKVDKEGKTDQDKQNIKVIAKENKEDETDKDVITINRTVCAIPSDLPKEGTLEYLPLQKGQTVFVTNLSLLLPWFEGILSTRINETNLNVFFNGGVNLVPTKSIAYFTESPVQFPVGTRVIAKLDDNLKKIDSFYAGIIAEPPKLLNKFR